MIYLEDTSGPVRVLVANGQPVYVESVEAMRRAMETRQRLDSGMTPQDPITPKFKRRKIPDSSVWCMVKENHSMDDIYKKVNPLKKKEVRTQYFTWGGARPGAGRPRKESNAR